jgi:hypothetical protein
MTAVPVRSLRSPGRCAPLRKLAGPHRLLLVGDSKLVSYANLRDIMAAEVDFIAPASKTYVPAGVLAALVPAAAAPVDHLAERDAGKPPEQRGSYRVVEDTMTIAGKRKADPVLRVRRVFVWSSARAGAAATARARKPERATNDLERLQRGLGSRHYPDADAVTGSLQGSRGRRAPLRRLQRTAGGRAPVCAVQPAHPGLVTVICLALLIFCLVERQVRRAIAPASTLEGLYLGQPAKPTGRLIFEALARLRLHEADQDRGCVAWRLHAAEVRGALVRR